MSIIGRFVRVTEYPAEIVTEPTVKFAWQLTRPDAEVDFFVEGIDSGFSGQFTRETFYEVKGLSSGTYVFHLRSRCGDDEDTPIAIDFTVQLESLSPTPPPTSPFPSTGQSEPVVKAPITQVRTAGFRGTATSADYNKTIDELYYDLSNLYVGANHLATKLDTVKTFVLAEKDALLEQVAELEQKVEFLKTAFESETYRLTLRANIMRPGYPSILAEIKEPAADAMINTEYGLVTLPFSSVPVSKACLYDEASQRIFVPDELEITVSETDGHVVETPLTNAFNGYQQSAWIRKVYYPASHAKTEETVTVTVNLPVGISSNLLANTIVVNPFPEGGATIDSVEISSNGTDWELLPGFPSKYNALARAHEPEPIINATRKCFCFKDTPVKAMRVKLTQKRFKTENNMKVFTFGLQKLDIYYITYDMTKAVFAVPVDITKPQFMAYDIESITPIFANKAVLGNQNAKKWLTYEVYQEEFDGSLTPVLSLKQLVADRLWLICSLYPVPGIPVTPALQSIQVEYKIRT